MDLLIVWISMLFTTVADTRGEVFPFNMAPDSVDDDYKGCSANMSKLVERKYLPLEKSGTFKKAWEKAEEEIQEKKPQLDKLSMNHAVAIRVYSYGEPNIYKPFNDATRRSRNIYRTNFTYHSLHFLLTEAVQRLKPEGACLKVYRRTNLTFTYPKLGSSVRFDSFTSTSLNPNMATVFGNVSCFEVRTCHGANVSKYSKYPDEKEVLIPPYEKFRIKDVIKKGNGQTVMKCETVYQLESSGMKSDLRCAMSSSTYHGIGPSWSVKVAGFTYVTCPFVLIASLWMQMCL